MSKSLKRILAMMLAAILTVSCLGMTALAEEPADEVETIMMHRMYNPNTREHFYTGSEEERDDLVAVGWEYEGVAWAAPTNEGEPVYRMFNPNAGDHHYTMSEKERDDLKAAGWNYEGVAWNSYSADTSFYGVVHYRLYNPEMEAGNHHYTASVKELTDLINAGWKYEGIAYYGYAVAANDDFHREYGHSFEFEANWTGAPDGCQYYACGCGVRIAVHDSRWLMTKAPTETAPGEKVRECSVCGKKETGEISADEYKALSSEPIYFAGHDSNTHLDNIYSMNPDGSDLKFLVDGSDIFDQADGVLLYTGMLDGKRMLCTYNIATGEITPLADRSYAPSQSSIALANGHAYYSRNSFAVHGTDLKTGETQVIFPADEVTPVYIKAMNGNLYVLTADGKYMSVYIHDPETKTNKRLFQQESSGYFGVLWPAYGGVLYDCPRSAEDGGLLTVLIPKDGSEICTLQIDSQTPITTYAERTRATKYWGEKGVLYLTQLRNMPAYPQPAKVLVYSAFAESENDIKRTVSDTVLFVSREGYIGCDALGDGRMIIQADGKYFLFDSKFFEQTGCLIPLNIDFASAK